MISKMIAVWGRAGSGKTTLAVSLAVALAHQEYLVGLISTRTGYGELQTLFGQHIPQTKGLYAALYGGDKNCFIPSGHMEGLYLLSVHNGMDALLLSTISSEEVNALYADAATRFDLIVVDGDENLDNPLSSIALTQCAKLLMLHHPSVADSLWYASTERIRALLGLNDKAVHLLSNDDRTCDTAAFSAALSVPYFVQLAHVPDAPMLANTGTPLYKSRTKGAEAYTKAVDKLARMCLEV